MLAGTSKRSAGQMKYVYQGDCLGVFGLLNTNVFVKKKAGKLFVDEGVSVGADIYIISACAAGGISGHK